MLAVIGILVIFAIVIVVMRKRSAEAAVASDRYVEKINDPIRPNLRKRHNIADGVIPVSS